MEEKEIWRVVTLDDGSFRLQFHDGSKIVVSQNETSGRTPKPGDKCTKQNDKFIVLAQHQDDGDAQKL